MSTNLGLGNRGFGVAVLAPKSSMWGEKDLQSVDMLTPGIVSKQLPEHEDEDSDPGLWQSDTHIVVRACGLAID